MYYNTTNETGEQLKESEAKAKTQQELILECFEKNAALSPSMILGKYPQWPITSIRRAITDLTDAGLLEKTDEKVMGGYGKKEHVWVIV